MGKFGINNTKEVITLGKVVTIEILKEVKRDGFQAKDLASFLKSPKFDEAVKPAIEGIELVVDEARDLDFFEGLSLAKHAYSCVDEILDALRA